eukprot:scaffold1.g5354.t1
MQAGLGLARALAIAPRQRCLTHHAAAGQPRALLAGGAAQAPRAADRQRRQQQQGHWQQQRARRPPPTRAGQQPEQPGEAEASLSSADEASDEGLVEYLSDSELEEFGQVPEGGAAAAALGAQLGSAAVTEARGSGGLPLPQESLQRVARLPLELATTLSKEDAHYLEKRNRSRWWRRSQFPRLPPDTAERPPPLSVWAKVVPLGLVFFAASFNLTILQNLKDAIMVTTAGAETLPFLASCVVLPASLGFFMLYGKLLEVLPQQGVFYAAISPLVGFYTLFTAVLYPLHGGLHLHGFTASLAPVVPLGLHGLLKVVEHWTFSLFYCAAELWGSVVISVLFWSLANEVCTVDEAKTVYPLMGIAANVALVLRRAAWACADAMRSRRCARRLLRSPALVMLNYLTLGVLGMTVVMGAAKLVVGPYCAIDEAAQPLAKPGGKKKKRKGSLGESFAAIRESPKILNLALLVVSYGVSHRLFEFAWKGQLRVLYPTAAAYQSVLADVSIATGWLTITLMVLGKFVFQWLGWISAAAATPCVMLLSGAAFFFLSLAANQGISVAGMDPAAMAFAGVAAGAVFARSSKFSLFDPAKEMVYIEMSKEEKGRGKAAVDLLGSQIGKSGGAWITQARDAECNGPGGAQLDAAAACGSGVALRAALLLALGSIHASLPVITAAFVGVISAWLRAVFSLGKQLKEYEEEKVPKGTRGGSSGVPAAAVNGAPGANGEPAEAKTPATATGPSPAA